MSENIAFLAHFQGKLRGLKSCMRTFLEGRGIAYFTQSTTTKDNKITVLVIEGERTGLAEARDLLVLTLNQTFPGIDSTHWNEIPFEGLNVSGVGKSEAIDAELSPLTSGAKSILLDTKYASWIDAAKKAAYTTLETVSDLAKISKSISDSFSGMDVKTVCISFKGTHCDLDVGKCRVWDDLLNLLLKDTTPLPIPQKEAIKYLYRMLDDGERCKF